MSAQRTDPGMFLMWFWSALLVGYPLVLREPFFYVLLGPMACGLWLWKWMLDHKIAGFRDAADRSRKRDLLFGAGMTAVVGLPLLGYIAAALDRAFAG